MSEHQPPLDDVARLDARAAIEDLVVRYCLAVDDVDEGALPPLFATHATHHVTDGTLEGRDRIVDFLLERRRQQVATVHMPAAHLVEVLDATTATGTVMARLEIGMADELRVGAARYHDRYVLEGGAWRFAHRRLEVRYLTPWSQAGSALLSGDDATGTKERP